MSYTTEISLFATKVIFPERSVWLDRVELSWQRFGALMDFYQIEIPLRVQPSLVLSVEREELGIQGGLQDRVVQCYGQPVYMDFSEEAMSEEHGLLCGTYETLDPAKLPQLYLAFDQSVGEPTEVFHNNIVAI